MTTVRIAVLEAVDRLERRHGRSVFALSDIIQEACTPNPAISESSVRTHIVSVMCREAPVNHANHANDLERMARGMYRRIRLLDGGLGIRQPTPTNRPTDDTSAWPWEGAVQAVVSHPRI